MNKSNNGTVPLVSVILPTYNRRGLLAECLENLSRQTHQHFEVCLVNDGGESLSDFIRQFDTLTLQLVEFGSNQGQTRCRNKGISLAKGEIIALCDDDDLYLPDHLQTLVPRLSEFDLVYSGVDILASDESRASGTPHCLPFSYDFSVELLWETNYIVPSSVIYRKSLHSLLGDFDESLGSYWDWDWFLRVAGAGRIGYVPARTVQYRFDLGGRNLSGVNSSRREEALKKLCQKHNLGDLQSTNFYEMAKNQLVSGVSR